MADQITIDSSVPQVCIVVPCYNHAEYLPESLNAILGQSFPNWECIIVNDGSADNTGEVAMQYVKTDSRIKYIEIKNSGPSCARNTAIERTAAEFILPLDADDKISPNYIQECYDAITVSGARLVYGQIRKFGLVNEIWPLKDYSWEVFLFQNMIHPCAMFKKADWASIGGYDINMVFGIEDWEFWMNLIRKTGKVIKLENITFFWRVKTVSRTTELNDFKEAKMKQYIYKKHSAFYDHLFIDPIKMYKDYRNSENILEGILKSPFRFAFAKLYSSVFRRKNK